MTRLKESNLLSVLKIISKYREFIQHIRNATKSVLSSNNQASIANAIVLIPIAANAINELNNILNRLIRISYTIEAESNYLRQPPSSPIIENKEITQSSNENRTNISNQPAISSMIFNNNSFKLTSNIISNIFEDFFLDTNDLFN